MLADNPLTYLRLNEMPGATVAQDASPNDRDGTYAGAPALGVAGPFGDAGNAAGLTAGASISATVAKASASVELWVNPNRLANGQQAGLVAHGDPSGDGWALGIGAKRKLVWVGGGSLVSSKVTLPASAWTLLTVVWTEHKVQIYRNGALAKSLNRNGSMPASSGGAFEIGGNGAGAFTGAFAGKVDEVALFAQALPTGDVQDHFSTAHVPINTVPPSITGTPAVGETLSVQPGAWTDGGVVSYRWQRCDANGDDCDDVDGATATTYVVAAADACGTLQLVETMTNASGAATAVSELTAAVAGVCGAPGTGSGTGGGAGTDPTPTPTTTTTPPPPGGTTGGSDPSTVPGGASTAGCLKLLAGRRTARVRGVGTLRLKPGAGGCLTGPLAASFKLRGGVKLKSVRYALDGKRLKRVKRGVRIAPAALRAGTHTLSVRVRPRGGRAKQGKLRLRVALG